MPAEPSATLFPEQGNPLRVEVRVSDEGLTEDWRLAGARTTPWRDVARVQWVDEGVAEVVTRKHTLRLDKRIEDLHGLVQQIERYAADRGTHGERMGPEWIEGRLRLRPGEKWTLDERQSLQLQRLIVIGSMSALAAFGVWAGADSAPWLIGSALVGALVMLLVRPRRIEADGRGITVTSGRRTRVYDWHSLERIQQGEESWIVRTADGAFSIPRIRDARRLADAIGEAIDGRRLHYAELNEEPLPAAALSRMTGDDLDADRGLSRVDA
jgi:hypothetical protein